ncbi:MAG TPA: hypothetical protein VLG49_06955 [Rhabdochlamydiaceae bacterium]|nr:hypothetical protein [Rhabdochlamydiaceae bacterium]
MINIKEQHHLRGSHLVDFLNTQFRANEGKDLSVDLSYHRLSIDTLSRISFALRDRTVKELDLSFAGIDDQGAKILSEALKMHRYINKVNLSHNRISNSGAEYLADAMQVNPRFQVDLRFNAIGPKGGEAIVRSSVKNPQIKEIDLSHNDLGDEGAAGIANALKQNSGSISKLVLHNNNIGFEGDKALAQKVPEKIRIFHRIQKMNFKQYLDKNPALIILALLFLPLLFLFSCRKYIVELEGCENRRSKA